MSFRTAAALALVSVFLVACSDVGDDSLTDPGMSGPGDAAFQGSDAPSGPAPDGAVDSTVADSQGASPGAPDAAASDAGADAADTMDAPAVDSGSDAGIAPDTSVGYEGGVDTGLPDAGAPDANVRDTSVPDTSLPDTSVPDANVHDTSVPDTSLPDTSVPESGEDAPGGGDVPCTTAGQTHCVPCKSTTGGVCTPTEAAFVQKDISAGHGATLDCYSCLVTNACIDDNLGDVNHECGDNSGTFNGGSWSDECIATLACILQTTCAAKDVQDCVCGAENAGNACQTATNLDGACNTVEFKGLGVSDGPSVLKDLGDTTRPAGMANAIFACAKIAQCAACVQ